MDEVEPCRPLRRAPDVVESRLDAPPRPGDGGRTLIQELKVGLAGSIAPDADPGALMRAAEPVSPGCPRGVVDPAGLQ